jgi:hypothetical protein
VAGSETPFWAKKFGPNTTFGWTANGAYVKNSPNREYVGCEWLNNRDIIVL